MMSTVAAVMNIIMMSTAAADMSTTTEKSH